MMENKYRKMLTIILSVVAAGVFGLLGFPAMGIKGAAWATVIGQITGALISIILNIKINKEIKEFSR